MPDDLSSKLRTWTALIVAVTGLATAVWKPQSHDAEKAGYKELSAAIDKLSAEAAANHDDVTALRGYVAAKEGEVLLRAPVALPDAGGGAGAGMAQGFGGGVVRAPRKPVPPPPPPAAVEPPPETHPPPAPVHPADFDSVVKGL
jgi:hypothetical protein